MANDLFLVVAFLLDKFLHFLPVFYSGTVSSVRVPS